MPLKDQNGEIVGIVGISLDITELKEAQNKATQATAEALAQERAKKAVENYAGRIAHDLRTPLATINNTAFLLNKHLTILIDGYKIAESEEKIPEPIFPSRIIETISEAPKVLSDTVKYCNEYISNTLKTLKAASVGVDSITSDSLVAVPIGILVEQVVRNYPFTPEQRKKVYLNTDRDFKFKGNDLLMRAAFENLIKNSLEQITLNQKGEIFITCENGDEFNFLTVKDTAGGAPPEIVKHIFDGFNSTKVGGTGIGLSSIKQTMKIFGGDIHCESQYGHYIEFTLSFPNIT